jgi:hypothetical protein
LIISDYVNTHLEVTKVDFRRSGNNIRLVDATKGHAVDLVRTSHKEKTALKLLEENNTLAAEPTGKEDKNGARSDGCAEFRGRRGLAALLRLANVLSGVVAGGLDGGDKARRAVLRTADLDLLGRGGLLSGLRLRLLLALEESSLGEDLRAREAADSAGDLLATGHLRK